MKGLLWAVSLALADETFLEKWNEALRWENLPKGPLQFILAAAVEHWEDKHQLLDWPAFLYYLDEVVEDDALHEEYRSEYQDLTNAYAVTPSSLPVAWEAAEVWIRAYHVGMALDQARAALSTGDTTGAFERLLGLREVEGRQPSEGPVVLDDPNLGDVLRRRPDPSRACPSGVPWLDELWEGGVYPGEFALIGAPTNIGKSMALCYFARSAYLANKRILYFSYELTKEEVLERILCSLFEESKKKLNPDRVVDRVLDTRRQKELTHASLVIDDGEGIRTVADLGRRLEQEDIDLVLLDSADDLRPRGRYTKTYEGLKEIYTDIRLDICQRMALPVWTSVQLNREAVERAVVSEKHVGDAFAKVQRAHLMVGMGQTIEERDYPLGPSVKLSIIKDTEHGSKGRWARFQTFFGRGSDGWPGFRITPESELAQL